MSEIKENLFYTESHEWVEYSDDIVVIGLSDYAQEELGDVVFVNLPEIGEKINVGEAFCDVESVKAVSDIISPVAGEVVEINDELADNPEMLNKDCYGSWICKVGKITGEGNLMDAKAYEKFLAEQE